MKIIDIKCPKCGGELHIGEGRKDCFCEYCGSHLYFDDENRTFTRIIRDEAKLKELEIEEENRKKKEIKDLRASKHRKRLALLFIVWLTLFILFFVATSSLSIPYAVSKVLMGLLIASLLYLIIYGFVVLWLSSS